MPELLTFCGRTFTAGELQSMRQITVEFSALGVTEISRTVCELLEWKRPNGGLKNHECRHCWNGSRPQDTCNFLPCGSAVGGDPDGRMYPRHVLIPCPLNAP